MHTTMTPHETGPVTGQCEGCEEQRALREYAITYRAGGSGTAAWCDECHALARIDHAGTIASIDGEPTQPIGGR